jgi:asparagine synthase (glutamine-hydrolysing)
MEALHESLKDDIRHKDVLEPWQIACVAVCGIAGIVDFDRAPDPAVVAAMAEQIAHRGPDDFDSWGEREVLLAHRRLSILDLSRDGRQPMADAADRYRLLHNGEIYNYVELRAELGAAGYRFHTGTDTEVILAAYDHWGSTCVEHFNGMWALALWDRRRRELFCARDRFGIKPFYYRAEGRRFLFASELKAFQPAVGSFSPNEPLVRDFLEHGLVNHTNETLFRGIDALPAGHVLTFGAAGVRLDRFWQLNPALPPADATEEFRNLFFDAVRLRLRSDVTVGTSLSGGLDSSAIACVVDSLMRTDVQAALPVGERQQVFTAYFEDKALDERPYAQAVVEQTRSKAHFVTFSSDELIDELPAIVEAQDEPFRSTSIAAQWYVMKEAKRASVKVMLDGQGGDEILGGYDGYFGYRFADLVLAGRARELVHEVDAYRRLRGVSAARVGGALLRPFLPASIQWSGRAWARGSHALLHPDLTQVPVTLPVPDGVFRDRFRRQLHLVLTRRLPELLRYEDRNSMAHSIEARLPFLDYRLAQLMFSLDPQYLIKDGRAKILLREAIGDQLPAQVKDRTDKLGFQTPESSWLRGRLGEFAQEVLSDPRARRRSFVDSDAALAQLRRLRSGGPSSGLPLWRAVSVELWAQRFLDR